MLPYKILRKGTNFFSKEDGTPLDRNDFLNILEPCLLHMSWCHLAVTLHSFRQGRASTEVNEGMSIEEIKHSCRWSNSSNMFGAYCRTDLVMMRPDVIHREYPQSRKQWTTKWLGWITKHFVQMPGPAEHTHHMMLSEEFPKQFAELKAAGKLPECYPTPECLVRMKTLRADRESEIFIKAQQKEEEQKQWKLRRREMHAEACHRAASSCKYDFYKNWSTLGMAGLSPSKNLSEFINHASVEHARGDANIASSLTWVLGKLPAQWTEECRQDQLNILATAIKKCRGKLTAGHWSCTRINPLWCMKRRLIWYPKSTTTS